MSFSPAFCEGAGRKVHGAGGGALVSLATAEAGDVAERTQDVDSTGFMCPWVMGRMSLPLSFIIF